MKTSYAIILAMLVGVGVGAGAVQALHAQAQPPAFYIAENDVSNPSAYLTEFAAKSTALAKSSGARYIVQGGKVTALVGAAPTSRIVIQQWDSMDKLLAWFNSAENTELQKVGSKYATIHAFAVEGLPQ